MTTQTAPTKYIHVKEGNKMMRDALKAVFPGIKFSIRKGTGTGSSWVSVDWTDGPTDQQVRAIVDLYTGSSFNGMTDGYDQKPDVLVAIEGEELPQAVHFICCGVNTHRDMSSEAESNIIGQFVEALGDKELSIDTVRNLWINETYLGDSYDMASAIRRIFYKTDFTK